MKPLLTVLITLACVAAVIVSFVVANAVTSREDLINHNVCLTDKAIVAVFVNSIKNYTLSDAVADPAKYERARSLSAQYIRSFTSIAPCDIEGKLPPDILR